MLLIIYFSIYFGFSSISYASEPSLNCIKWFKDFKLSSENKSCESECAIQMVDMATFLCPSQCKLLCKSAKIKVNPGRFIYYPGLTPNEKKLVEEYPQHAITVFIQKTRAEIASNKNFPEQGLNDEGDAFRHFLWAGLLAKEPGEEIALKFLNAHENNRLQPSEEKRMDSLSNQSGIDAARDLIKENKFNIENLEQKSLDSLRKKQLSVINPGLTIPEVPK